MREVDSRIERVGDKVVVVGDSFGGPFDPPERSRVGMCSLIM